MTDKKNIAKMETKTYILENLCCANCAAKIEDKIRKHPGVGELTFAFATKKLKLTADTTQISREEIQRICDSVEENVHVLEDEDTVVKERKKETRLVFLLKEHKKDFCELLVGSLFLLVGVLLSKGGFFWQSLFIFVLGFLLLGREVLLTAVKNILKGKVFDENFLMSIATLGAFIIGEYPEALGVMLFYRLGELFENLAVEKTRGQIMEAVDMRPELVTLIEDKTTKVIEAKSARIGDLLEIKPGDRIPLDGVVIRGESRIDTAPITGEPLPKSVGEGDSLLSGCLNLSGRLTMRVEKVLKDSMVSRILEAVENAAAGKPKVDRFITRFSRVYTPIVVAIALFTAIIPSLLSGNWSDWIYTALTFLVISCPCALVLSVPLAFFSGIGAGSKRGILFKSGLSIEAISDIKAVIMDKTGTVTQGDFKVQEIVCSKEKTEEEILYACSLCEQSSTHPIAVSIMELVKSKKIVPAKADSILEISGKGIVAKISKEEYLCGNSALMEEYGVSISPEGKKESYGSRIYLAKNREYLGYLLVADSLKEDAQSAVKKLHDLGLKTAMLTGDSEENALYIKEKLGINKVFGKLLPEEKLKRLEELRKEYGSLMFVGDGINDAPVLAGANVGAAMGSGSDAAIEAADLVLMRSSVNSIVESIVISRSATQIAWQNIILALTIKVLVMILGLLGFASMWMAVFADTGVAMICIINSIRILYKRYRL